jgi:ankyrin repeat protein
MVELVRSFRWKEVKAALVESPGWLAFRDERGRNLLHLCCGVKPKGRLSPGDSVKTAAVLLDAGLDIDREAFSEGNWKATPLWYAVGRGENLVLAKYLLERGADPENCLWAAAFRDDVVAIRLLVAGGASLDPVVEDETPFLAAVKVSHFEAAEALLDLGADVDHRDSKGMTALHYMLKKGSPEEHVRMLIRHGARVDLPNREGVTAGEILARKRSPGLKKIAASLRVS